MDDGSGFDAGAAPPMGHFGLQAMRERTDAVGAALDVRRRAEGGTVVTVTWPAPPAVSPRREESIA
jgi:two-component system nitrate/nitrite sensor histidine kinase NarQ